VTKPFRFLAAAGEVSAGNALAEKGRRAEALGYDVLVFSDHLINQMAPIPAMAVIAAATERLRIGTFVFNNDLRHPAVLAQDLASLDQLSGGRLEIGIGAGWNRPEYEETGIPFDSGGIRVKRLEEAIQVLKGIFGPGPFSFKGEHYTITEMDGLPKPIQKPHPPILVGGGGRRLLSLAGREANIVGFAPRLMPGTSKADIRSCLVEATLEKVAWVKEAAGQRFQDIELNTYPALGRVIVTDDPKAPLKELAQRLQDRYGVDLTQEQLLESPHVFVGSIADLTEKFKAIRLNLGISSFMTGGIDELAPVVERLAGN